MIDNIEAQLLWACTETQPWDVRGLSESERDNLIVTIVRVDGNSVIVSRYGDDYWQINDQPNNRSSYRKRLDFLRVPDPYRAVMKAIVFRYLRRGRAGQPKPKGATLSAFLDNTMYFLRYLASLKIDHFSEVTPIIFTNYAAERREFRQRNGKPLSQGSLLNCFHAVEALYELSQHTHDALPMLPWPGTSSKAMAGLTGDNSPLKQGGKTPLMPDAVFCTLFEKANEKVQNGKFLLNLRDAVANIGNERKGATHDLNYAKNLRLVALGWEGGLAKLNQELNVLRTACYIVLASTTGCRNHELANVQSGSHRRTEDDDGTLFHWIRSRSEKTDAGICDWMIPDAAVRALRLMERWAEPYQANIANEITARRKVNPLDPEIANAQKHRYALFLGMSGSKNNQVRTFSLTAWNRVLKDFAKKAGLDWSIASHQFRRKFANYVAHSQFGDLRYLREHFAHWSMDMTLGYAMDESWGSHLDLDLYDEIQREVEDIKLGIVDGWLSDDLLAGGFGSSIRQWKREPSNLAIFKDHKAMVVSIAESTAIRSNGHAWCTADNDGCVGNTLERTRCGGCDNAVISSGHLGIYRQLYNNLKDLLKCSDIGEGGLVRVLRDLERCREVFIQLGYDPESNAT